VKYLSNFVSLSHGALFTHVSMFSFSSKVYLVNEPSKFVLEEQQVFVCLVCEKGGIAECSVNHVKESE